MQFFRYRRERGRPPHPDVLTPAEWRVLEHVRAGRANAEIAVRVGVSVNTVRYHVSNMLAKLELHDRAELAAWHGEPAASSRAALRRFTLAAPLTWLREGSWVGKAAATAAVVAISVVGVVAIASLNAASGGDGVAPPVVTPTQVAEETPTPEWDPGEPHRRVFAPGEVIDAAPAVLFIDPDSGETEAWVLPDTSFPEFGVASSGDYIIYYAEEELRLFRTDDESDVALDASDRPHAYAPGGLGFIAPSQEGAALAAFDDHGRLLGDVGPEANGGRWFGGAWGAQAIAATAYCDPGIAGVTCDEPNLLRLLIHPVQGDGDLGPSPATPAIEVAVPEGSNVSLRWSHSGNRLALVTDDRVRVLNVAGDLLWEFEGEFSGNPRWSPDDAHLFVNAMPPFGGNVSYLFARDGDPAFRHIGNHTGGCSAEVWLDSDEIALATYRLFVDGRVDEVSEHYGSYPDLTALGIELAADVGRHHVHYADEWLRTLDDGRVVITTPEIGHGGCAIGISGQVEERLERPPFE